MRELFPGDVIQIKPEENVAQPNVEPIVPFFQGCFAIVRDVYDWGVEASIWAPQSGYPESDPPGEFPISLVNGTFVYIGVSVYHMGTRDDV